MWISWVPATDDESEDHPETMDGRNVNSATNIKRVFIWSHLPSLSTVVVRSLAEIPEIATAMEPFMYAFQVEISQHNGQLGVPPTYDDAMNSLRSKELLTPCNPQTKRKSGENNTNTRSTNQIVQVVKGMPCHGGMPNLDRVFKAFQHRNTRSCSAILAARSDLT